MVAAAALQDVVGREAVGRVAPGHLEQVRGVVHPTRVGQLHLLRAPGAVGAQEGFHVPFPEGEPLLVRAQGARDGVQRFLLDDPQHVRPLLGGLRDGPDLLGAADGPQIRHVRLDAVLQVGAVLAEPARTQLGKHPVEAERVDVVRHVAHVHVVEVAQPPVEFGVQFPARHPRQVQAAGPVELVQPGVGHLLGPGHRPCHLVGGGADPEGDGQGVRDAGGKGAERVLVVGGVDVLAHETVGEPALVAGGQRLLHRVRAVGDVEVDVPLDVPHGQVGVPRGAHAERGGAVQVDVLLVVLREAQSQRCHEADEDLADVHARPQGALLDVLGLW